MADPEFGAFQAKECQNHLENAVLSKLPVEILVGKKNLEVRPTMVNKGEIVKRLLAQHPDVEFVACAGDDKTDEDMFRALAGQSNSQANGRREQSNTVVEPYNADPVAETAAKIAQAALGHSLERSLEHSPIVPHAHVNGQVNGHVNGVPHHDGTHLAPPTPTPAPQTPSSASPRGAAGEHFSITIGHALKRTLANWHVTSPEELIRVLGILSGVIDN